MSYLGLPAALVLLVAIAPSPNYPPFHRGFLRPTAATARKKTTGDDLSARGKENGYQRGAHRDKDSLRDQNKHVDKVKKDQNAALDRYIL